MVLHRHNGTIEHCYFYEVVDYLPPDSLLVLNNTRVIPARLWGRKKGTGGKVEILLLRRRESKVWEALIKGRKVKEGGELEIPPSLSAQVIGEEGGIKILYFPDEKNFEDIGHIPLPPYIHAPLSQPERYQTVYAQVPGSVAAPTAGLHFTPQLLDKIRERGIKVVFVTLHLSLDSFRPVRAEDPLAHPIYKEYGEINPEVAQLISQAKRERKVITCVGTSTVRIIEQAALKGFKPFTGWVGLFILPGHHFKGVDRMITNFHLPRSTNLMLVSAFAGKELLFKAYQEAINRGYRFYSFGDAMLIL
jgi:S-adenosylmethionine:tRNA ribosyltransferase-isomerase